MATPKYTSDDVIRFWAKVALTTNPDECWEWRAATDKDGYGRFKVKIDRHGEDVFRNIRAHRMAWHIHYGDIPDNMQVLHRCDNPPCVNPHHLFLGTTQENTRDRDSKGRQARQSGERNAMHRLTDSQIEYVRQRYKEGGVFQEELARELGVSQAHISNILRGKRRANP